jgi:hypothetical protein
MPELNSLMHKREIVVISASLRDFPLKPLAAITFGE